MRLKQLILRTMSTFTSRTNVITGNNEWVFVDEEEFDYQQELARSAFADMLHDHERNVQYDKAISKSIRILSKLVNKIHVLDIGTGTGLLAMMAARAFDEIDESSCPIRITACEVFRPMANIARQCIEKNKLSERIRIVDKRSTEFDLNIDLQGDSINMIIAEVFDTELIGEGALRTFSEACKHLTADKENLRIVPARATIYVQLVESSLLQSFHTLNSPFRHHKKLNLPNDCRHLAGNTMFDLNVNEIREHIRPLSKPIPVFDFDFKHIVSDKNFSEEKIFDKIICQSDGQIDAFIMWWMLDMDEEGEIQLGTTPIWCYDDEDKAKLIQWREHWIHGIYYPRESLTVKANDQVSLYCFHDEYSLYFDVGHRPFPPRSFIPALLSRSAVAAFNSSKRREKFTQALEQCLSHSSVRCLYVGDGLLLPSLVLDSYPNVELIILQSSNTHLARTLDAILSSTQLNYRIIPTLDTTTLEHESIDVILAEPFFSKSLLPWDNLHFYYLLQQCRPFCRSNVQIFPRQARIRCLALEFLHLHKIRSPIHRCCGFDLSPFDEQIMQASLHVDACIEPQPLFEYASRKPTLSPIIDLVHFDFRQNDHDQIVQKTALQIPFVHSGICNGIAFWIDFELNDGIWLTTGIEKETDPWVIYCKQGVHLLPKPMVVKTGMTLNINTGFDFKHGQFLFDIV